MKETLTFRTSVSCWLVRVAPSTSRGSVAAENRNLSLTKMDMIWLNDPKPGEENLSIGTGAIILLDGVWPLKVEQMIVERIERRKRYRPSLTRAQDISSAVLCAQTGPPPHPSRFYVQSSTFSRSTLPRRLAPS